MRELAAAAGVSVATPFNRFGSKSAIMHALCERRIDTMTQRFHQLPLPRDLADRVSLAVDTAVAVMLEEPVVNRAVMGWIGTAGPAPGQALTRSTALWEFALRGDKDLPDSRQDHASGLIPRQLALAVRGVLSFWTSGELLDEALNPSARDIAATLLRGSQNE